MIEVMNAIGRAALILGIPKILKSIVVKSAIVVANHTISHIDTNSSGTPSKTSDTA